MCHQMGLVKNGWEASKGKPTASVHHRIKQDPVKLQKSASSKVSALGDSQRTSKEEIQAVNLWRLLNIINN